MAHDTPDYMDLLRERGQGALDKKMGIELLEASPPGTWMHNETLEQLQHSKIANLVDPADLGKCQQEQKAGGSEP